MNYKMKANALSELAGMQQWERDNDELKYLHFFMYKDEEFGGGDAWPGKVKIIEQKITNF